MRFFLLTVGKLGGQEPARNRVSAGIRSPLMLVFERYPLGSFCHYAATARRRAFALFRTTLVFRRGGLSLRRSAISSMVRSAYSYKSPGNAAPNLAPFGRYFSHKS